METLLCETVWAGDYPALMLPAGHVLLDFSLKRLLLPRAGREWNATTVTEAVALFQTTMLQRERKLELTTHGGKAGFIWHRLALKKTGGLIVYRRGLVVVPDTPKLRRRPEPYLRGTKGIVTDYRFHEKPTRKLLVEIIGRLCRFSTSLFTVEPEHIIALHEACHRSRLYATYGSRKVLWGRE